MYSARRRGAWGTPLKPGMVLLAATTEFAPVFTQCVAQESEPHRGPEPRVQLVEVRCNEGFRGGQAGRLEDAQLDDPVAQRGRGGIRVEQRGARRVERGGDAHREVALVFEDVEIVVDADPRQLDQLVTEMHWLGGGAPPGE